MVEGKGDWGEVRNEGKVRIRGFRRVRGEVHAKTPGLYQVPKLRNLNLEKT